jgi:hypothetical protein
MKVKFKYGIATYSGTVDEMVYGSYNDDKLCLGREFVYPRLTEQNALVGTVAANLKLLWATVSVGYKADLKKYAERNKSQNVPKTQLAPYAYGLFIKLMYNWQKDDPEHVDLSTVTNSDVDSLGAKISTVKNCVLNGMLPGISNYGDLTAAF